MTQSKLLNLSTCDLRPSNSEINDADLNPCLPADRTYVQY